MARNINEIVTDLELFCIDGDYLKRLKVLTDELLESGMQDMALTALLSILERYPDEELGSPGPLLFAIKKCKGHEDALVKSVESTPASLTVWAVYQLAKKSPERKYIEALSSVAENPNASNQIKEDAELLLSWLDTR